MISSLHPAIRLAATSDISACKTIADQHRAILGFLPQAVFRESAERQRLLVAVNMTGHVVGFVRFNHRRRGSETALYDICVDQPMQGQGIGRALMRTLAVACHRCDRSTIILRCPEDAQANLFYRRMGGQRIEVVPGKRRSLVVWRFTVEALL